MTMMAELFTNKTKSVQIEANCLSRENASAVALWCGGLLVQEHDALNHDITYPGINVPTNFGMRRAQEGDWIIKRHGGDFLPVSPDRFDFLFEAVVDG